MNTDKVERARIAIAFILAGDYSSPTGKNKAKPVGKCS